MLSAHSTETSSHRAIAFIQEVVFLKLQEISIV